MGRESLPSHLWCRTHSHTALPTCVCMQSLQHCSLCYITGVNSFLCGGSVQFLAVCDVLKIPHCCRNTKSIETKTHNSGDLLSWHHLFVSAAKRLSKLNGTFGSLRILSACVVSWKYHNHSLWHPLPQIFWFFEVSTYFKEYMHTVNQMYVGQSEMKD